MATAEASSERRVPRAATRTLTPPRKKFTCHICHKTFLKFASLKKHMQIHSQEILLQTREVSTPRGAAEAELALSEKDQESGRKALLPVLSCSTVGKTSAVLKNRECTMRLDQLDAATAVASGLSPRTARHVVRRITRSSSLHGTTFTCQICAKEFLKSTFLEEHMQIHSRKKQSRLGKGRVPASPAVGEAGALSELSNGNPLRVEQHSSALTPSTAAEEVLPDASVQARTKKDCPLCGKAFTTTRELKRHVQYHSGKMPFKCHICKRRFATKLNLNTHLHSHSDARPFECDECDSAFTWKANLLTHLRIHSEENKFKCNECNRGFSRKNHFDHHMQAHSREKPFKCRECDSRFSQKNRLVSHMRTHVSIKH